MISILMPFQNEALHLDETLKSILAQTEANFELIAMDDHSNDHSMDILRQYSHLDSRVKVFSSKGEGTIPAICEAFELSRGNFVTRHDADDLMPKHKLSELKKILLLSGRKSISTGKVKYFSALGVKGGFKKYEEWLNNLCDNENHFKDIFKECVVPSPNWMMFREDFQEMGAFKNLSYPEDHHMALILFERGYKVVSSKRVTHYWRDHPSRASRTQERYADQKNFSMKCDFIKRMFKQKDLVVWGAGPRGKELARTLINLNMKFKWITDNNKKIGKKVYGVWIESPEILNDHKDSILFIAVSQRNGQSSINSFLRKIHFKKFFEI
jgi:glycosyltransferase involved in cell wall biosynthesis